MCEILSRNELDRYGVVFAESIFGLKVNRKAFPRKAPLKGRLKLRENVAVSV